MGELAGWPFRNAQGLMSICIGTHCTSIDALSPRVTHGADRAGLCSRVSRYVHNFAEENPREWISLHVPE
jgi:hypothetical protein